MLGVKKIGDTQNHGGVGHRSLSSYQKSCPFWDGHVHFLPAFGDN